jgi:hypothetical protein
MTANSVAGLSAVASGLTLPPIGEWPIAQLAAVYEKTRRRERSAEIAGPMLAKRVRGRTVAVLGRTRSADNSSMLFFRTSRLAQDRCREQKSVIGLRQFSSRG